MPGRPDIGRGLTLEQARHGSCAWIDGEIWKASPLFMGLMDSLRSLLLVCCIWTRQSNANRVGLKAEAGYRHVIAVLQPT
jgi:hypothetical protein